MRYLIYTSEGPFFTEWFTIENCYKEGMLVFDLAHNLWTGDGETWHEIEVDQL